MFLEDVQAVPVSGIHNLPRRFLTCPAVSDRLKIPAQDSMGLWETGFLGAIMGVQVCVPLAPKKPVTPLTVQKPKLRLL
jgi:hypothetical protein